MNKKIYINTLTGLNSNNKFKYSKNRVEKPLYKKYFNKIL